MCKENYDERQLKIRGDVYRHCWIFTIILMLINFFITGFGKIIWAQASFMFILICTASIAFGSIEMLLRDVYVGRDSWRMYAIPFCLLVFGLWTFFLSLHDKEVLISEGMLSRGGVTLLNAIMFVLVGIVGVYKFIKNRRTGSKEAD
ncbi:MAG: hypothetical protein LBQ95_06835 [Lachnospiraceae bacterium]|nr:hypothetical protein [Lachnospiraceae bacterium]